MKARTRSKVDSGRSSKDCNQFSVFISRSQMESQSPGNAPKDTSTRRLSSNPSAKHFCNIGWRNRSKQPCCRVQSEASKLPLSTEETKSGARGKRARIVPVQQVPAMLTQT